MVQCDVEVAPPGAMLPAGECDSLQAATAPDTPVTS